MRLNFSRREFLRSLAIPLLVGTAGVSASEDTSPISAEARLAKLEGTAGTRLGVYALETGAGKEIRYRADERFPLCSTFKLMLTAAILRRSVAETGLLQQRISYTRDDLVSYSPRTEKHVATGMTVAELCAAAIQYSDNTAANLLMKFLGGPAAVTEFAHNLGNHEFRLDRWETELNTAFPGDSRDTSTPAAMGGSLQKLLLEDALPSAQQDQLKAWLLANTTGAKRIRSVTPTTWQVGDKTGSGDYGTANDLAILWPPGQKPIILAIYLTQKDAKAKWYDETIAAAAQIVLEAFATAKVDAAAPRR